MNRLSLHVATLLLVALTATGCKSNLGGHLRAGKEAIETTAQEAMDELVKERADNVIQLYETRGTLEGDGDPLLLWAQAVATDGLAERANAMKKSHARSKLKRAFQDAEQLLKEQEDFWKAPKGKLNGHMALLKQYIDRVGPKGTLVEYARFDQQLVHAWHLHRIKKYDADTQLTSFYRYWKYAFDLQPTPREPFMFYINRLCQERLGDYCKTIMWEDRAVGMKKPYFERLIKNLEQFLADYPQTAFRSVIDDTLAEYRKELQDLPSFEEYPVLPDGRTTKDAVAGHELMVGPRGLMWDRVLLHDFPKNKDGEIAMTFDKKARAAAVTALSEKLAGVLKDEARAVEDPTIDRVIAMFDRVTPLSTLAPLFQDLLDHQTVELGLIARRRADGTNRKVGVYLTLFYTPPPIDKDFESRKTKEQREADAKARLENDPRRKVPNKIAGMTCQPLGRTGRIMASHKAMRSYVAFGAHQIRTGGIEQPESYIEKTATADKGDKPRKREEAMKDLSWLEAWAASLKEPAVIALSEDLSYDDVQRILQRALIVCKTPDCTETEERDVQLTLAICK